jgi:hypothetical protein
MFVTAYESDGTPHVLQSRNEWGRHVHESTPHLPSVMYPEDGYWYRDMRDGRYVRDDELITLYSTTVCPYCGHDVHPPEFVPWADEDDEWETLAEEHAKGCEWVVTRGFQVDKF